MSGGPVNFNEDRYPTLEAMMAKMGSEGFSGIEKLMQPAAAKHPLEPEDEIAKRLYSLWAVDRQLINWLFDLTILAPYPQTRPDMQELAFAACRHQTRALIGEAIQMAIAKGHQLSTSNQGS